MQNILNYILSFTTNAEKVTASIDKLNASTVNVEKASIKVGKVFNKTFNNINKKLNSTHLASRIQNIGAVADGLSSLAKPGLMLTSSLQELSAITGVTGKKLKEIEGYARENAKVFGGDAASSVESYKLVLSQLSPEIAKQPKALEAMGKHISALSKTMGGDTVAATEVLTTAMNQYGVSTEDPMKASEEMSRMMNIMAAAAKEGSAELPQQKAALEQSGMAAKAANVSFAETAAAIQVLDKAGKRGSEGGVALRNVMTTLSQGRFMGGDVQRELVDAGVKIERLTDKSLSLSERMRALEPIIKDDALIVKLFGKENSNAALALMQGIDTQEALTKAITGTNTAYEQAAIVMEAPAEKNARLKARIDDFKLSLFNATNGAMGYLEVLGGVGRDVANLIPLFSGFGKMILFVTNAEKMKALWTGIVTGATKVWTAAQWLLNAALSANPIGLIIIGITALIALVVVAINKFDSWGSSILALMGPIAWLVSAIMMIRRHWESIVEAFQSDGIIGGLKRVGQVLLDVIMHPLQRVLGWVAKVTKWDWAKKAAGSVQEFREKLNLVTDKEKQKKEEKATGSPIERIQEKLGLVPTGISSVAPTAFGRSQKSENKSNQMKTNRAIATGGTKHNYITLNINKEMIGNVLIKGKDFKESAKQMQGHLTDSLLRIMALATTA